MSYLWCHKPDQKNLFIAAVKKCILKTSVCTEMLTHPFFTEKKTNGKLEISIVCTVTQTHQGLNNSA